MNLKNGYIAAAVAVPVAILMALSTTFDTVFITIVLFAILAVVWLALEQRDAKKTKQKKDSEEFNKFHEECKKFGIDDLKNPGSMEKKQRLALIVKKYGYSLDDPTLLQRFNALGAQKQQERKAKKDQAEAEAKQKEMEQYVKLTYYSQFHGMDKPVTMFKDRANQERQGASGSRISKQKESDGMIMAGIASGIGGVVPAMASLSRTAQNNEAVRQQNQAVDALNMASSNAYFGALARERVYKEKADELAVKLIGDTPGAEAFRHLKFENIKTKVSQFGSVTVEAEAKLEGTITVFDKPGFIDGYVTAEIYDGHKKIGEALMVFPAYGSVSFELELYKDRWPKEFRIRQDKPVKLEGMCLECGEPGKEYTVKFVPGDLWVMER